MNNGQWNLWSLAKFPLYFFTVLILCISLPGSFASVSWNFFSVSDDCLIKAFPAFKHPCIFYARYVNRSVYLATVRCLCLSAFSSHGVTFRPFSSCLTVPLPYCPGLLCRSGLRGVLKTVIFVLDQVVVFFVRLGRNVIKSLFLYDSVILLCKSGFDYDLILWNFSSLVFFQWFERAIFSIYCRIVVFSRPESFIFTVGKICHEWFPISPISAYDGTKSSRIDWISADSFCNCCLSWAFPVACLTRSIS